jgi:hypothetical protein
VFLKHKLKHLKENRNQSKMANIILEDLGNHNISGIDLFHDSENYFSDLNALEIDNTHGGITPTIVVPVIATAITGAIEGYLFVQVADGVGEIINWFKRH